jgi:prevent-host-death family protein
MSRDPSQVMIALAYSGSPAIDSLGDQPHCRMVQIRSKDAFHVEGAAPIRLDGQGAGLELYMVAIPLADAKAQLSELVDRVQAGDAIEITRRGKPVARLTAIAKPRKRIDAASLRSLTSDMPDQSIEAADLIRSMRDDDRY